MEISTFARVPKGGSVRPVEVVESGRGEKTVLIWSVGICRFSSSSAEGLAARLEDAAAAIRRSVSQKEKS